MSMTIIGIKKPNIFEVIIIIRLYVLRSIESNEHDV